MIDRRVVSKPQGARFSAVGMTRDCDIITMITPTAFTGVVAQNMMEYGGIAGSLAGIISTIFDTVSNVVQQTSTTTWVVIAVAAVGLWLFLRR